MFRTKNQRHPARGFTLTELLVVISIIAILMSFMVTAVFYAFSAGKDAATFLEINHISQALEAYKREHGFYPPDGTNFTDIQKHWAKIFTRRDATNDVPKDDEGKVQNLANLDPAEALVFFLQGYTDNKRYPLTGGGNNPGKGAEKVAFMNFRADQLDDVDEDGWPEFYPKGSGSKMPLVYFNSSNYGTAAYSPKGKNAGTAKPYKTLTKDFVHDKTYQIISAGSDNHYGRGGLAYPILAGAMDEDLDNVCNFCRGTTLEADIP